MGDPRAIESVARLAQLVVAHAWIPVIGPLVGAIFVVAIGLPQSLHVAALSLLVLVGVRHFQSYVVNPHIMGHSVGLSPLVTLVSVSVVSILFGGFAVVLAVPFTSAVGTLIDVFVLDHDPPPTPKPKPGSGVCSQPRALIPAIASFSEDGNRTIMSASLRYLDIFARIDGSRYFAERKLVLERGETRPSTPGS